MYLSDRKLITMAMVAMNAAAISEFKRRNIMLLYEIKYFDKVAFHCSFERCKINITTTLKVTTYREGEKFLNEDTQQTAV